MSKTGQPVQILWAIIPPSIDEKNPYSVMENGSRIVFVFTNHNLAEAFTKQNPNIPANAVIGPLEVAALAEVLDQLAQEGASHICTDPQFASGSYLGQQTLTIEDYLDKLGN